MSRFADRIALLGTENAFRLGGDIAEVEASGRHVIRCNLGEPDFPLPGHIREELKRQIDADNVHYTDPQGQRGLREAVARKLAARGIPSDPERVVIFPGAKPIIGLAQHAYVNAGDEVVYPSPGFPIYESFIRYVGGEPKPLLLREEDGFAFSGDELSPLLSPRTALVYLNFPSNPTGGVANRRQLEGIADAFLRGAPPHARVFADEIYEDIIFDGAHHQSIAAIPDMAARTIVVSGVSKSFSWTGGRVGWALFPTVEEAQLFKTLAINYFSCVAPYAQEGARRALESPLSAPAIHHMVNAFQQRRDAIVADLNRVPGVRCLSPRGAFYLFPNVAGLCERLGAMEAHAKLPEAIRAKSSPSTLLQMFLLHRHGLATMDRKSFGRAGAERQHFLRLSIATALSELKAAMLAMAGAADDRAGFERFVREGKHLA